MSTRARGLLVGAGILLLPLLGLQGQEAAGVAQSAPRWYRADRVGNTGEPVTEALGRSLEYAVERTTQGALEVERLYRRGELLEERRSGPREEVHEVYLPDGSLDYEERIALYRDGSPREVRRTSGDETRTYRFRRSSGQPFEEWFEHGEDRRVWRFGPGGRLVETEAWRGNAVLFREEFSYSEAGDLRESRREDPASGEERVRRYESGRLVTEEVRMEGRLRTVSRLNYDAEGRIEREERRTPDGSIVIDYTYSDDGRLESERQRQNGQITLVVRYTAEGRIEDRYRDGSLVLRSYFDGDTRVREELYRSGRLIDVRRPE